MPLSNALLQVNKKTRTQAYQLLVDLAHELDDARPLSVGGNAVDSEDELEHDNDQGELSGGLIDFVQTVLAGLVGASPHMQVGISCHADFGLGGRVRTGVFEGYMAPSCWPVVRMVINRTSRGICDVGCCCSEDTTRFLVS